MKSPITGKEMVLRKEKRTMTFRKDEFEVVFHYYQCEDTGESFTTTETDEVNINQLYNQYREKYKLPFPDEIRLIREKYGLPASKMSEVLGFGANVYRSYESGEVPNQSNARLIQLVNDPREFRKLVYLSKAFEGKALDKILQKIESLIQEEESKELESCLVQYLLGTGSPNVYTGYRVPNLDKLTEMVVYFTEKIQPIKLNLNKLLFYADFKMFSKTGQSISGLQYNAFHSGPAPLNYQSIFEFLTNRKVVEIDNIIYPNGSNKEQFKPNPKRQFEPKRFTDLELLLLEEIAKQFKKNANKNWSIINLTEKALLKEGSDEEKISYNLSFVLDPVKPK